MCEILLVEASIIVPLEHLQQLLKLVSRFASCMLFELLQEIREEICGCHISAPWTLSPRCRPRFFGPFRRWCRLSVFSDYSRRMAALMNSLRDNPLSSKTLRKMTFPPCL